MSWKKLQGTFYTKTCRLVCVQTNQTASPQPEPGATYFRQHQGWLLQAGLFCMWREPAHGKSSVSTLKNLQRLQDFLDPLFLDHYSDKGCGEYKGDLHTSRQLLCQLKNMQLRVTSSQAWSLACLLFLFSSGARLGGSRESRSLS